MTDFNDFVASLTDEQKAKFMAALSQDTKKPATTKPPQKTKSRQNSVTVSDNFIVTKTEDTSSNSRRREPVRAKKNEWKDEGEFRDIETNYGEKTPRNRQPQKKIDVECSVCGRSFKTDPRYIYGEYHRCSRCVGK
jgi:hypothetical protein